MMLPRAAADEEMREGREIRGLDLLARHGFLLPPTTTMGYGGGASSSAYEKTAGLHDEPLRFASAASETLFTAARPRPRPVDVPAPPAMSMPKQPASAPAAEASSSPKLGSFRGVCGFQVPSSTTPPGTDQLLAAAGQGTRRASPLMQRAPCTAGPASVGGLFFGNTTTSRPPPVAAGRRLVFEGSASASATAAAAWTRSTHDDDDYFTAPMTILYAGSLRAYDGVTMEQAEKILAVVAKEAHAAGILAAEPQLQLAVAAAPTATGSDVALMTMHYWRLARHHVDDSLKRTASLARFLDKRKQRAESSSAAAATIMHHPLREEEWFPAQRMAAAAAPAPAPAPVATVSARTSVSLGGLDRRPRASQDHPNKRMKAASSHGDQEAVSTELRI